MKACMVTVVMYLLLLLPGCASQRPFILHTSPPQGYESNYLDECIYDESLPIPSSPTAQAVVNDVPYVQEVYEEYTEEDYWEEVVNFQAQ